MKKVIQVKSDEIVPDNAEYLTSIMCQPKPGMSSSLDYVTFHFFLIEESTNKDVIKSESEGE